MLTIKIIGLLLYLILIVAILIVFIELDGSTKLTVGYAIVSEIGLGLLGCILLVIGLWLILDDHYYNVVINSSYNNYSVMSSTSGKKIYRIGRNLYIDSSKSDDPNLIPATINYRKADNWKVRRQVVVDKESMNKVQRHKLRSSFNPVLRFASYLIRSKVTIIINR